MMDTGPNSKLLSVALQNTAFRFKILTRFDPHHLKGMWLQAQFWPKLA